MTTSPKKIDISTFTLSSGDLMGQELTLPILKSYGLVVVNDFVKGEDLHLLNEEFDQILSQDNAYCKRVDYSVGQASSLSIPLVPNGSLQKTKDFFLSDWMESLSFSYFGTEINLNSEVYVVKDVVGSKHVANDLHYDVIKTLKFFIYLSDTDVKNGAFSCVPGSHKKTMEYRDNAAQEITYQNRNFTRKLDLDLFDDPLPISGKAGTLIIFDTDVWHKAGHISEGSRRVMRGHTRPKDRSKPSSFQVSNLIAKFSRWLR